MTETTIVQTTYYTPGLFVMQLINIAVGIIEALFAIRIVLELFAANPGSEFVAWIYGITGALIGPFAGAFPNFSLGGGAVIDVVAVIAMIAYAVLGWLILQILTFIFGSMSRSSY